MFCFPVFKWMAARDQYLTIQKLEKEAQNALRAE